MKEKAKETGNAEAGKDEKAVGSVRVIFKNSYIGTLGSFHAGQKYTLTGEQFKVLRNDCTATVE